MSLIMWRSFALGGFVVALSACAAGTACAAVPGGPRLAMAKLALEPPTFDVITIGPRGEEQRTLARWELTDGMSWSPDGSRLAYGVLPDKGRRRIVTVGAGGGKPRAVRGTRGGSQPVFSPDGRWIAFARTRPKLASATIWIVEAAGGKPRRLAPWNRNEGLVPYSFSPTGVELAAVRRRDDKPAEVVILNLADGTVRVLAEGTEPSFSPDGSAVVYVRPKRRKGVFGRFELVRGGDLFVVTSDGSTLRRLTYTPKKREAWPGWDPSGERLVFTRYGGSKFSVATLFGLGNAVMTMNADGTCRRRLLFDREVSYQEATWQPGPGREAGRILC
jgi:TolB protein